MTKIFLRRGKEESLGRRHPWVFSGAIERTEGEPAEGDIVDVYSRAGDFLARGHYQRGSIMVRVLTFSQEDINAAWWHERLAAALAVRRAVGLACNADSGGTMGHYGGGSDNPSTTCYRLVHGEGDELPGLVVDIYGTTAVVQCHSVGMFLAREHIVGALRALYDNSLTAIFDKSSQTLPFKAEVGAQDGYLYGSPANTAGSDGETGTESTAGTVLEGGNKFVVEWGKGQKTGFFIDQRDNRALVGRYSRGRRVLNTFCYTGGFSVYALRGGAAEVVSVDSSAAAVEMAVRNVALNFGENAPHEGIAMDTFEYLKSTDKSFDLIILDPPAFAKHHKVLDNATRGYIRLNARAISQIAPGGILFTFSCSQAVSRELFRTSVFTAAAIAGRRVRILHQLSQPADHPIGIYHPEGGYLKGLVLYVE